MKINILFFLFLLYIFILPPVILKAQVEQGSSMLSFTGAFTIIGLKDTDATITGGGFQAGFENYLEDNLALGFALGYLSGVEEEGASQIRYTTVPFWIFLRYLIGENRLKFYFTGGFGFQLSERDFSGPTINPPPPYSFSGWDNGISLGLGTGINYDFNDRLSGILSYNAQYLSNTFYKNGLAHVFNFGIGYKL